MKTFKTLLLTRDTEDDSVVILTLNRPEAMNSFNTVMFRELQRTYADLDSDPSVRVIIVTGAGRAFCAGADISDGFGSAGLSQEPSIHEGVVRDAGGELVLDMFNLDTPIIGAINGHAVGIGATMTMAMDIRICSEKTKWAFPFARRGIVFDGAASWFLPRLATSTANNKRLLRDSMMGHGVLEKAAFMSHIAESRYLNEAFVSADCEEGVRAFLEKRPPNFADRTD